MFIAFYFPKVNFFRLRQTFVFISLINCLIYVSIFTLKVARNFAPLWYTRIYRFTAIERRKILTRRISAFILFLRACETSQKAKRQKLKLFFLFSNNFTQCQPLVWSEWLFFAWHFLLSHVEGEVLMNCIRNNNIFVWNCSFTSGKMSSNWPIFAHGDSCVCFEFKKFSQLMLNFSNRRNLSITKANHYQTNI